MIKDFAEVVKRQQEEIRKRFIILAKLYPGAFDRHGKPIVATTPPLNSLEN